MEPQMTVETLGDSPKGFRAWTKSDDAILPSSTFAYSFAGSGAIVVTKWNDQDITIPDGCLAPGIQHIMRIKKIKSTGTSPSDFMIFYRED